MYRQEHKLGKRHLRAIRTLSTGPIYRIKREIDGNTALNRQSLCHTNVEDRVRLHGGRRIDGWLWTQNKQTTRQGLESWRWHSIWAKSDSEWIDVTHSDALGTSQTGIFLVDEFRSTDLTLGTGYNSILYVDTIDAERSLRAAGVDAQAGRLLWFTGDPLQSKKFADFDGRYKWLAPGYEQNVLSLEQEFGIKCDLATKRLTNADGSPFLPSQLTTEIALGYSLLVR